ncbi:indolepyruvate ferredoxin oxidoreductase alpha subunit [Caldicoprobacter guelmensis]|uniref:indolepyruvate ferredoxin oxidoreductase subunit alpha n=1 Tax=Caldicoprobacter guelmensis TaxID=1170224 RepID=UPI001957E229|nr:indolepyruvate ferredoxin oxidoreductase alpha subunit [Caldicoprobacter guelmensis]
MKRLMLGNEAIARGAYEAGVRVVAAYPGTPSTEITEFAAKYEEIYAEWSPNEKVALEVAIGASFAGARAMVAMKHVGLNVAADPLFTVSYTGVNGGLVIVVADDPGMHSSQNEQDSRYYARASQVPMLEPADSQEALDFVKFAFELSERYDTPVIVRLTTRVAHSQSIVTLGQRVDIPLKEYKKLPDKNVMMPAMARKRHIEVEKRMKALAEAANDLWVNRVEMGDISIGIIASGITYQYAKEALPNASFLKLGMVNPLPRRLIESFASKVQKLYIIEELDPVLEEQIKSWGIPVTGKEIFPVQGELSANIILERIAGKVLNVRPVQDLPPRPPVMCPGCPHRGIYYVMKKLRLHATGDIGCYTLGALPPLEAIDTCVCMGASVGMAHGMEKARGRDFSHKLVAVIGDSTFIHSGITGLIDIVYNRGASTIVILDNSTTGMTGHQDHPGTGRTLKGDVVPPLNLVNLVRAIGIEHVRVVDPFDLEEVERVLKEETQREEPSVVIARRLCALLSKEVKAPLSIDVGACRLCGLCLRLGCPAIEKKPDGMYINQALCNGCGLCVKVCKFGAIRGVGE